jgi:hypothetical protein
MRTVSLASSSRSRPRRGVERLASWSKEAPAFVRIAMAVSVVAGCTPEIGDKCVLSTDCSIRGDRLCDTSQPGGYCTVFNCRGDSCPDKAACVLFNGAIQGCGFDDRAGPFGSRTARSFCVARCFSNSDCRDDYVCADPRKPPWGAIILDDDQGQLTCLVKPAGWDQPPPITAAPPSIDRDAGAPPPFFPDAGKDAGDGGVDAGDAG